MGSNITHVANASGVPVRVYYSSDQLTLEEIHLTFRSEGGIKMSKMELSSASGETKMVMKRDSRIRYIRIPPRTFAKIVDEGKIFVTVFLENDPDDWQNISENFQIPQNRSFIVTARHHIKFQKLGANIWEDEQGYNHWK